MDIQPDFNDPHDRKGHKLHLYAGMLIAFCFSICGGPILGLSIVSIAAVSKELIDCKKHTGSFKPNPDYFSLEDVMATLIGGGLGVTPFILLFSGFY